MLLVACTEQVVDLREVTGRRVAQLLEPGVGQHRVDHPPVSRTRSPLDIPGLLETVEQPGHPRSREQELAGEIDPPEPLFRGLSEA